MPSSSGWGESCRLLGCAARRGRLTPIVQGRAGCVSEACGAIENRTSQMGRGWDEDGAGGATGPSKGGAGARMSAGARGGLTEVMGSAARFGLGGIRWNGPGVSLRFTPGCILSPLRGFKTASIRACLPYRWLRPSPRPQGTSFPCWGVCFVPGGSVARVWRISGKFLGLGPNGVGPSRKMGAVF